jgi:hypothetical protein
MSTLPFLKYDLLPYKMWNGNSSAKLGFIISRTVQATNSLTMDDLWFNVAIVYRQACDASLIAMLDFVILVNSVRMHD